MTKIYRLILYINVIFMRLAINIMKHKHTVIYILGLGFALSLVAGCSEKPEAKAAKEAREQANKAMAIVEDYKLDSGYDYAAARAEVDKAVALANKAGGQADSVYFASAELTSAYASKQFEKLSNSQEDAAKELQGCTDVVLKLAACQSQMDTIGMLQNTGTQEAGELETLLTGQKLGVETKLNEAQKQLAEPESALKGYQNASAAAKKSADQIQMTADNMLREAQLLEGLSRIELERKAYSMLQGSSPDTKEKSVFYYNGLVQENLDLAESVSVQINTVKPLIAKLSDDIAMLAKRIDELKNQDKALGFSEQAASLRKQYDELKSVLAEKVAVLNSKLAAYQQQVEEQAALYVDAQENYAKVNAAGLRENAELKIADCSKAIASLHADAFAFAKRIAENAKNVAGVKVGDITDSFSALSGQYDALVKDYTDKVKAGYDKAFQEYQGVIDSNSSGQFADVAVRNYMAAIYARLNFDTMAADAAQIKETLLAKIGEIKEISIQADPTFANSKIAALFAQYGIEFKTAEQKLQEQFLGLKVEFAACTSLEGQEKQDKLLEVLGRFNGLEKTQDEQFYADLVKYIYDTFRDDWIAISEAQPESETIALFKEFITRDTQPEEQAAESGAVNPNDPNATANPSPNPNF